MERAGRLIAKWKKSRECVTPEDLARAAWSAAVGRKIAAHATGFKLVRNRLVVRVEDEIWRQQLFALRHQILKNLDEKLGAGIVEKLEFRIEPRRIPPTTEQQARRKPAARQAVPADEADGIADPVLREIYKKARHKAS